GGGRRPRRPRGPPDDRQGPPRPLTPSPQSTSPPGARPTHTPATFFRREQDLSPGEILLSTRQGEGTPLRGRRPASPPPPGVAPPRGRRPSPHTSRAGSLPGRNPAVDA